MLRLYCDFTQIDAVAKSRDGKFRIVSNDEREQTLNQLLTVILCGLLVGFCFIVYLIRLMSVCLAGDGWI